MGATQIVKKLNFAEFKEKVRGREVKVSDHALFRLSEAQRKVFKAKQLMELIVKGKPILAGLQNNGKYTAFFKLGKAITRVIFEVSPKVVEIITFYNVEKVPQVR